ncbi:probable dolichol-phosphate mannosyltransferase subunit 3 [Neocloeon triangulifer]|uniref:probable dolichol-phosphate mannosyltransferase subunit 3 n=1 Tax=Neocloeon triangulifer TaxID=2078957 RepID=UPI00286F9B94|nr:probable dolichol-phosphate mannosyltransferase subunit 3 [Neocloeon triangulifer]
MTMLMQWLQILVPAGVLWATVTYTALKDKPFQDQGSPFVQLIILLPFLAVIALGLYAVFTVLWKTLYFNDCTEASEDLKKDIAEAKEFLKKNKLIDTEE